MSKTPATAGVLLANMESRAKKQQDSLPRFYGSAAVLFKKGLWDKEVRSLEMKSDECGLRNAVDRAEKGLLT